MALHLIKNKLFEVLQKTLLQLDPELYKPLEEHLNKTICIQITHFPPLIFIIEKNHLRLCESAPSHIDTTFEGTLSAFLEMMFSKKPHSKGLHIKGDMECAKALYDAWQFFDCDFENQLAKVFGDTVAHTICKSLRQSQDFMQQTFKNRKEDIGIYLQNEKGLLVSPLEVEDFYHQVSSLRDDVERFAAKIQFLQHRIEKRNQTKDAPDT